MKIHTLSPAQIRFFVTELPDDNERCVYEAGPGDRWRSFFVARVGWSGGGTLPGTPARSYGGAIEAWKGEVEAFLAKRLNPRNCGLFSSD